jgi:hypothetical protein
MSRSKSLLAVFCLLFAVSSSPVHAETDSLTADSQEYQIDSMSELKEEIQDINSDLHQLDDEDAYQNLVEQTNPEVIQKYSQQLDDEIANAINEATEDLVLDTTEDIIVTNSVELPDGGVVEVEQSLVREENPEGIEPLAMDIYYPYGTNTAYKATVEIRHILYPATKLVLQTGFNISSKGIRATYASKAGTSAFFPNTVSSSAQITDSTAYTVGHDINAQGDYDYAAVGVGGSGVFSSSHTIISTIKLLNLKSKGATVRVSHQHLR